MRQLFCITNKAQLFKKEKEVRLCQLFSCQKTTNVCSFLS